MMTRACYYSEAICLVELSDSGTCEDVQQLALQKRIH